MSHSGRLEEYGFDPFVGERLKVIRETSKHHQDRIVYYVDSEGRKHGTYRTYTSGSKGHLLEEMIYCHGILNGPFTIFHSSNGKIHMKGTFVDGLYDGLFQQWYPGGEILSHKCYYRRGIRDGEMLDYYQNGQLMQQKFYVDGIITGPCKTWKSDGQLYNA